MEQNIAGIWEHKENVDNTNEVCFYKTSDKWRWEYPEQEKNEIQGTCSSENATTKNWGFLNIMHLKLKFRVFSRSYHCHGNLQSRKKPQKTDTKNQKSTFLC